MVAVVGILGQEILGVHPAWYLHGEKVRCNFTLAPNYTKYAAMSTAYLLPGMFLCFEDPLHFMLRTVQYKLRARVVAAIMEAILARRCVAMQLIDMSPQISIMECKQFLVLNMLLQEYWLPINALTAIMFPIIAFFEITRLQGFAKTGKVTTIASANTPAPFSHTAEAHARKDWILLVVHCLASHGGLPA